MELYYCRKLFGITFKEVFDIDKYHEDVQTLKFWFRRTIGCCFLYADFSEEGKRNGAWMTS
jgi:peptidyl-dipeptidase Dcp